VTTKNSFITLIAGGTTVKHDPPVKRALLKRRDYKVDLDSKLGKSVVITKNTPSAQAGG
jgi:U4/U6.U5 tri-snRNP component SNU23